MGMSKKQFAKRFGPALAENPRKYLRGHKIKASGWKLFTPDVAEGGVLTQLMYVAHSLKKATKGAAALRKADNFLIHYYKTEGVLIDTLADDITEFVDGLPEKDQETFSDNDNIYVIGYYPNTEKKVTPLKLSVLLRNGYKGKFGRGEFVVVMWGDSAIRTSELRLADMKSKVNARKAQKLMTPAKIKARLKKKAQKVIKRLNKQIGKLSMQEELLNAEMQEFNTIAAELGLKGRYSDKRIAKMLSEPGFSVSEAEKALKPKEKQMWAIIKSELRKKGKRSSTAKKLAQVAGKNVQALYDAYVNGVKGNVSVERQKQIRKQIKVLRDRNKKLQADIDALMTAREVETDKAKRFKIGKNISAKAFTMRKNNAKIKQLRAKLGVHKSLTGDGTFDYKGKSTRIKEVKARIDELKAMGASERQALAKALAEVDMPNKQQVVAEAQQAVAEGLPAQYAAQQAIQKVQQQTVSQQNIGDDDNFNDDISDVIEEWI